MSSTQSSENGEEFHSVEDTSQSCDESDSDSDYESESAGDTVTQNGDMITLITANGEEVKIERSLALQSTTIQDLLSGPRDGDTRVHLPCIPYKVLKIVCRYFKYRNKYSQTPPEEMPEFKFNDKYIADLIMAANFLGC